MNACGVFIAALADLPVLRQKAVLHILDPVKSGYEDGPGVSPMYIWEHKTLCFATDPVAVDRVGVAQGLQPVALTKTNRGGYLNMQPEHIEFAGALGPAEAQAAGGDLREDEDGGRNAEAPASGSGAGARDVHLRGGRPQSGRLLAPPRTPHLGNPSANLCS